MKLENNGDKCEVKEEEEEIMMTDIVVDDVDGDDDGDGDGDGNSGCLDPGLSKCLVHLPRKWTSDNLRKFLNEQVCYFLSFGFLLLAMLSFILIVNFLLSFGFLLPAILSFILVVIFLSCIFFSFFLFSFQFFVVKNEFEFFFFLVSNIL